MAVNVARPGYELWRPNRVKSEAKTTKAIVALVFLISAGLLVIITLGGWKRLESPGVGAMTLAATRDRQPSAARSARCACAE